MDNLISVKDPMERTTTYSHCDVNGRAGRIAYPNGLVVDIVYNARGWPLNSTSKAGGEERLTSYEYDPAGQLMRVVSPDGSSLSYVYDDAHRLIRITDTAGNAISYTLDLTGNRVKEEVSDASGTLASRVTPLCQYNLRHLPD